MTGRTRIPELDGLRGLAILMVLVWHYVVNQVQPSPGWSTTLLQLLSFTWSGVDLFFVLSGFLLGGILMDESDAPHYFRAFYFRRAFRILPVYYTLVVAFALAQFLKVGEPNPNLYWLLGHALPDWSYATFTQNFVMAERAEFGANALGVTWSLAIEEQFYLVLPWIIRRVPRANLGSILLTMILCAPLVRLGMFFLFQNGPFASYVLMPCRMDSLFLGVLLAWALRDEGWAATLRRQKNLLLGMLFVLSGGALSLGFFASQGNSFLMAVLKLSGFAFLYGGLLWFCVHEKDSLLGRLCRKPVLRGLGTISYAVYLFHQPVSGLAHAWLRGQYPQLKTPADVLVTLTALVGTLVLALASWHLFEKHLVRKGQAFAYR